MRKYKQPFHRVSNLYLYNQFEPIIHNVPEIRSWNLNYGGFIFDFVNKRKLADEMDMSKIFQTTVFCYFGHAEKQQITKVFT